MFGKLKFLYQSRRLNFNVQYVTHFVVTYGLISVIYRSGYEGGIGGFNYSDLTKSEFENFNRNIAADFNSIYAFYPTTITRISFDIYNRNFLAGSLTPLNASVSAELEIDNIKILNQP